MGFSWDPPGTVVSLIERWAPSDCSTEKEYENSLYEFLHRELPDVQITKQYAMGRARADMYIGSKLILEVKTDLNRKGEYQRLLGQILELKARDEWMVVVLTGNTDPYFPKALREHFKDWVHVGLAPMLRVVQK
jgi:predicted DNA binding CopG/RHH family protein